MKHLNIIAIIVLMVIVTALRIYIPNGVTMGLLYGFPLFLSTPIRGVRWIVPTIAGIIVAVTSFLPSRPISFDINISDKISMLLFLIVLSYLGSLRCSKNTSQICFLKGMNDDLKRRIERYDKMRV